MPDAIDLLTLACVNAAKASTTYNVWNTVAPSTENGEAYVLVRATSGNSANPKQFRIERISITFGIYTRNTNINADALAGDIKDGIVDSKNNLLITIDNPKAKAKYLNHSDTSPEPFVTQAATFINRFITINFEVVTYS